MKPAFRWPWLIAGAVALFVALLAAGLSVGDLERALVRDANAVVAAPRRRATHVDQPRAGRFSDALRPAYDAFVAGFQANEAGRAEAVLAGEVARGERPVSDLPPELASRLEALVPLHDAVLSASHAESADLGPEQDPFGPFTEVAWFGVQHAARLSAIRIWLAPDAAARSERFTLCLDGLGLGRDAAISGGLVGRMVNAATVTILHQACGASLASLPPERLEDAARRLRLIRDAWPPVSDMLREEMVQVRLLTFGPDLPEPLLAALAERPRAFAADGSMRPPGLWQRLVGRLTWRSLEAFQRDVVEASQVPAAEREAAFDRIGASSRWLFWLLRLPEDLQPGKTYAAYVRRDEAARLRLDLLVAAVAARRFRAQHGRWPERVAEVRADGWLQDAEAARLVGAHLLEEERGDSLRLLLPLPRAGEEGSSEAALTVRAAPGR